MSDARMIWKKESNSTTSPNGELTIPK